MKKKLELENLTFIMPGFLIYLVFMFVPIALCLFYSLTNWDGISSSYKIIGLRNFSRIFSDVSFLESVKVTIIVTLTTSIIYNTLGIATAALLNYAGRAYNFCKSAVFLPAILSPVVVSFIWAYMTQTDGGIINHIITAVGMGPIDFFASKDAIAFTVSGVIAWAAFGFFTTVYIAALKTIPNELYESAKIDGAGIFKQFRNVTLPLLTPGITVNTILSVTWGLKQYDFIKVMAPNTVQTVTVNAIERAFDYNMMGYSSSIVLVLFVSIVVISLIQIFIMKKFEVEY